MGAGASALPDTLSLEEARKIAGEKFDISIFKAKCDDDGCISREVLMGYEKKEMQHANTMPSRFGKTYVQGDHKLTQAESMSQLWRKATGLARPTSVKDIATGFILAKRAAWADPNSSPLTPNRGAHYITDALTPVTSHVRKHTFDATPIEESVSPCSKHDKNNKKNGEKIEETKQDLDEEEGKDGEFLKCPHLSPSQSYELHQNKSVTSYDESMDSNDSLLVEGNSRQELLNRNNKIEPLSTAPPQKQPPTHSSPPLSSKTATGGLRLNLGGAPLTLDLNAPPADRRGLTLMTDIAGTMKAAGNNNISNNNNPSKNGSESMNDAGIRKFGSKRESKVENKNNIQDIKLDRADSFGDLLEGVDGIINVDEGDESFMMTPRKSRGMTLNLETSTDQEKSMLFTDSGAIELKGIDLPIRDTGMVMGTDSINEGNDSMDQGSLDSQSNPSTTTSQINKLALQDRAVRLEKLGQGAAGVVYKAFDLEGLELVALKEIPIYEKVKRHQMVHELNSLFKNLTNSNEQTAKLISEGKDISKNNNIEDSIGSTHVVAFIDAFSNLKDATVSLMVEYMNGGSLQNIVDAGGCEDHVILANIAKQSLLGLRFLHRTHNLHRDIKPANMLINYEGEVKISDFGIIRKLEHEVEEEDDGMMDPGAKPNQNKEEGKSPLKGRVLKSAHTFVGTVTFMSPERIDGESYSTPSDIWSIGLSLMTCALGEIPLRTNKGYWSLLQCVRDEDPPSFDIEDKRWCEDFKDFCRLSLIKDPNKRATCDELLSHRFLKRADYLNNNIQSEEKNIHDNFEQGTPPMMMMNKEEDINNSLNEEKKGDEDEVMVTRSRSNSAVKAQEEIGQVMREGGESELDAMLTSCYQHFEQLYHQKRQSCLAPLNKPASEASNALESLSIFFNQNVKPKRKSNQNIMNHNNNNDSENTYDSLSRLAGQLNLPVSTVRRRVELLIKQGPSAIARRKRSTATMDSSSNELKDSKRVLFDTLESNGTLSPAPTNIRS